MAIVPHLRSLGLDANKIVLPVAGCTGLTVQFGAVVCLNDSFGTFLATSAILDLSDLEQNQLAAAYLRKASACATETKRLITALKPEDDTSARVFSTFKTMDLAINDYWIKQLTDDVFARGLGLFTTSSASRFDVCPGLEHMGRVLTLLYKHADARQYVVFPLSVRSPNCIEATEKSCDCYAIVYENLAELGYCIGAPNRLLDEQQYQRYLGAVRRALEAIHAAGVLHCDLYPSNIMWCESARQGVGVVDGVGDKGTCCSGVASSLSPDLSTSMSIKIIDWDCAHCLAEGAFCPRVADALAQHNPFRSTEFGIGHDLHYLEILEKARSVDQGTDQCQGQDDLWQALASKDKVTIDRAFYKMYRCSAM